MQNISAEQALKLPNQLRHHDSQSDSSPNHAADKNSNKRLLSDDSVTLLQIQGSSTLQKIRVESYKNEIGQDKSLINETLKNKLSEYSLNPNTRLSVEKNLFGTFEIKGALLQSDIEKITQDLNNNLMFKDAFSKLSQQEPTLNYVDNVVKISTAYGVSNNIFNSLLSDKNEFNQLNDIAHRYEALRDNTSSTENSDEKGLFKFELNI